MPVVAGMYKSNQHKKLSSLLRYSVIVTSILSTVIAIVFFTYGDSVLTLLFGAAYEGGLHVIDIFEYRIAFQRLRGIISHIISNEWE